MTLERAQHAELARSEERTRLALSAINGVGAWTYRPADDCFRCDASFASLYGLDVAQAQAQAGIPIAMVYDRLHPEASSRGSR